jgi:hypothetical protein
MERHEKELNEHLQAIYGKELKTAWTNTTLSYAELTKPETALKSTPSPPPQQKKKHIKNHIIIATFGKIKDFTT